MDAEATLIVEESTHPQVLTKKAREEEQQSPRIEYSSK